MICTVHSIPIKPGKVTEAQEATIKAAQYSKEKYPGVVDAQVLSNISGRQHRLHLVIYYESFAVLEERRAQNPADAEWQKIVAEARDALNFDASDYNLFQVHTWSEKT